MKVKELSMKEGRETTEAYPLGVGEYCGDEVKTGGRFFSCTRAVGHDGPHVAHIPGPSAVACWDDSKGAR